MHEGGRAEGGLARQACVCEEGAAAAPDRVAIRCRQLHEEVVRMLPIDEGMTVGGPPACLQEQRIPRPAHRRGIDREHRRAPNVPPPTGR
jgi:hypothetical protein